MPIDILIEGLLFYKSAPQKKSVILKLFGISEADLTDAVVVLKSRLATGAVRLLETSDELSLVTAPELSPVIEALRKSELKADIGKAGAETLAIVLYQEPISRADIDQIRGVNSGFILRNLMIRGLVNREHNKARNRFEFTVSPQLLSYLGVTNKHDLPDFARIADTLEKFYATDSKTEPELVNQNPL